MLLPSAARVGLPVRLSCQYDLEGAQLYSIKWYHDETEFYSYVPKEEPATRIYPDNGIAVDVSTQRQHKLPSCCDMQKLDDAET